MAGRGPHTPDAVPGPLVVVVDLTGQGRVPGGRSCGGDGADPGQSPRSAYWLKVHPDGTAEDKLPNHGYRLLVTKCDAVSPSEAGRIARKLAGWSITGAIIDKGTRVQKKVATEWHQLVGAEAVEQVTPARWRMFVDTDRDRLRIPFGHELKTGDIMYLDIKEERNSAPARTECSSVQRARQVGISSYADFVAGGHASSGSGQSSADRLQGWFDIPGMENCRTRQRW